MNKDYQNLVADITTGLDLKDPGTRRDVFEQLVGDLQGDKNQNQRGVTALQNWEKTGDTPSEPGPTAGAPEKELSLSVRKGDIPVTENSKDLYKDVTGEEFPGTGERSDQEIANEDMWDAFEASGHQTGKKPKGMDEAIMDEGNGRENFEPDAPELDGGGIETFGPSKALEGLFRLDAGKYKEGLEESMDVGIDFAKDLKENITQKLPGLGTAMETMEKTLEHPTEALKDMGAGLVDIVENPGDAMHKGMDAIQNSPPGKFLDTIVNAAFGDKESLGKIEKMGENLAGQLPDWNKVLGGMMAIGDPGSKKGKADPAQDGPEKKKEGPAMDEESFFESMPGKLAAATAFKKCRKAGMSAPDSGMVAGESKDAMNILSGLMGKDKGKNMGQAQEQGKEQGKEKSDPIIDKAKIAKDMAMKVATKAVSAIPVVGPALALGLQVANVLADIAISANKATQKGGPDQAPSEPEIGGLRKEGMQNSVKKGKGKLIEKITPLMAGAEKIFTGAQADAEKSKKGHQTMQENLQEINR